MKDGPLSFLFGVALLWAGARALMLWPVPGEVPGRVIRWAGPLAEADFREPRSKSTGALLGSPAGEDSEWEAVRAPGLLVAAAKAAASASVAEAATSPASTPLFEIRSSPAPPPEPICPAALPAQPTPDRVTLSTWALLRPGIGDPLAPGGQLAGSQAGARATFRVAEGIALAARVSGPLHEPVGKEAAFGVDLRAGPVTLALERRIGVDRGGRDAFALTLFGGVNAMPLPAGFRLDAWGQAGIVGARRRDAFIDGIVRAERAVAGPVAIGAGVWGGAQPGAARLDIGPQLVLRGRGLRLSAEWRQRIAGRARPGSGPAVTLGADF